MKSGACVNDTFIEYSYGMLESCARLLYNVEKMIQRNYIWLLG